jgi:hypothetical protein
MSCFAAPLDEFGRLNIGEPFRQGLVMKKSIMDLGRSVTFQKWALTFLIVTKEGIFFFKHNEPECSRAYSMINLKEEGFKVNDVALQGKFLFEIVSKQSHVIFDCANFTEKDEWKKAIQSARAAANAKQGEKNDHPMKAEVKVTLKEAKDLQQPFSPYCKVIVAHDVKTSNTAQNTQKPQWNQEFAFNISQLPTELMIIMYDNKNKGEIIGVTTVKIEVAGERGDQRDWYDVRPVRQGEKTKGKVHLTIKTRYDAETQQRVTFGVRLGELMKRESHKNLIVPDIAYKCIKLLNARALELQGVFRVPGNKNKMRDYELRFDREGTKVEFAKSDDEHMIASIFKMFLRDMPEPVMPYSVFEATVEATTKSSREQINTALRDVLAQLPPENYRLLMIACCLLYKITLHVDKNLMKPTNLAIVFGPVFCAPPPGDDVTKQQVVAKLPALSSAAEYMISDYPAIFHVPQGIDPIDDMVQCNNQLSAYVELLKQRESTKKGSTEQSQQSNLLDNTQHGENAKELQEGTSHKGETVEISA